MIMNLSQKKSLVGTQFFHLKVKTPSDQTSTSMINNNDPPRPCKSYSYSLPVSIGPAVVKHGCNDTKSPQYCWDHRFIRQFVPSQQVFDNVLYN